jgi:hypothetical protein
VYSFPLKTLSLDPRWLAGTLLACYNVKVIGWAPLLSARVGYACVALLVLMYPLVLDTSLALVTCTTIREDGATR